MSDISNQANVSDLKDRTVVDPQGDKVGSVFDVYLDNDTQEPEWLAVSTGMFGSKISFVPIAGLGFDNGNVTIAYDKTLVKDSPRAEADGQLSEQEERDLYRHYGKSYEPAPVATERVAERDTTATPRVTDDATMVRSEEELSVGKHTEEAGRVKLRKWVETEHVHVTVPVQRQMARLVREPVRDGDTTSVGDFVEGEEEIVLSEEVVDVNKRAVAKERVGLATETITEEVPVDETLRKERVDVDGDLTIDRELGDRRGLGDQR